MADQFTETTQETRDGVHYIVFNRPDRKNAMSLRMLGGLKIGSLRTSDDPGVDSIVLRGSGDSLGSRTRPGCRSSAGQPRARCRRNSRAARRRGTWTPGKFVGTVTSASLAGLDIPREGRERGIS
jgi:1,4-dihydroxy-2-naphthoyl-CoA synthase